MSVHVAVCGPGNASPQEAEAAEQIGILLAEGGAVVVCGGLGGVMDAAARGARSAGGTVVGILPGDSPAGASEHLTVAIPTGLGEARNALIALAADALIAVGGEFGTLSEIALALKMGKPVVGLNTWELVRGGQTVQAIERADTAEQAVKVALKAAGAD